MNIRRNSLLPDNELSLRQHIEIHYKGNVSAFARDVGTSQTQAQRWLAMDCVWLNGQVWKKLSKFKGIT